MTLLSWAESLDKTLRARER